MTIAGVTNNASASADGTAKASDALGRDDFLTMLVAQLQYQDPLNPMDGTDFTAQLAQFSSLEQLTNMNDQLKELNATQADLNNAQAVTYIGRTVVSKGNITRITEGLAEPLQLTLEAPAAEVFVGVYDAAGTLRSTFSADDVPAGRSAIAWSGTDMDNNSLPDGHYWFEVAAIDGAGNEIGASPLSRGRVSGVAFEDGEATLVVNGQATRMTDVVEVIQGDAEESPS